MKHVILDQILIESRFNEIKVCVCMGMLKYL